MSDFKKILLAGAMALVASAGSASAAQTFAVDVWTGAQSTQADVGSEPARTADAHFDIAGPIDWRTSRGVNLFGDFFTQDGGIALPTITAFSSPSSLYGSVASFLAASMSIGGDAYSTFFHITGAYSTPTPYSGSIAHDDGASLYIDSGSTNVFLHPSETSVITDPAVLPAGSHNFDLYYVEGNGAPSVLSINFPDVHVVPEPASLALLGAGLAGLGVFRRRRG